MEIKVNGELQSFAKEKLNILELLKINEVEKTELVTVQLNDEFVDKNSYESVLISANDEVEFLYFMGGGA